MDIASCEILLHYARQQEVQVNRMKIIVNGKLCEATEAYISAYDHGFLYGMGLFETFRTYAGKPFLLNAHMQRIQESCRLIGIEWIIEEKQMLQWIEQLLRVNGLKDGYFRFSISAGEQPLGLPTTAYEQPTLILYIKSLDSVQVNRTKGHTLKSLQLLQHRRNTPESLKRLKSFHYMNNVLAKFELQQYPWAQHAEGVMLNDQGFVAEGIVSNLFFVKDQQLHTPSLHTGILDGITRECVIDLARKKMFHVNEGLYTWSQLLDADEIFLTNSIQGIVVVNQLFDVDGTSFSKNELSSDSLTSSLIEDYLQLTESGK